MFGIGGKVETVIGEGAEFRGHIAVQGAIYINGRVEGNVNSDGLITVGPQGMVKGNLHAPHVVVGGEVDGNVHATARVELLGTARLRGDIRSPRLRMADGAIFEGNCEMIREQAETVEFGNPAKK